MPATLIVSDRPGTDGALGYATIHRTDCRLAPGAFNSSNLFHNRSAAWVAGYYRRDWTEPVPMRCCPCVVTADEREAHLEHLDRTFRPGVEVLLHHEETYRAGVTVERDSTFRVVGRCDCEVCGAGYCCRSAQWGVEPCFDHTRWEITDGAVHLEHVSTSSITPIPAS